MLDNLLISAFADVIPALGFVERYGALVRPIRYNERAQDGTTYPVAYPVSCLVDSSCSEAGTYKGLTPDSAFTSVSYFERRASGSIRFGTPSQHDLTLSLPLRFVAWLNFKRLGVEGCPDTLPYALAFIKTLRDQSLTATDTSLSQPARVQVKGFDIPEQRADAIFAPYSYAAKEWAFMPPYGFFAVDLVAEMTLSLNCFTAPDTLTALDCVTVW